MRRLRLSLLISLACISFLTHTNPKDKDKYTSFLSDEISDLVCERAHDIQCNLICVSAKPVIYKVLKILIDVYTEDPNNYLLFTVFHSDIPGVKISAIGIGGRYFFIRSDVLMIDICKLIE